MLSDTSLLEQTPSDVPTLLAIANPMGEVVNTLAKVDGAFYFSIDSCLTRLTLGAYKATNYLEPWAYKNSLLSALYIPDQYKYLKDGDAALEFSSEYNIPVETSPLIDISGGYDSYMSRLTNKRRNEIRKLQKESAGYKISKILSSKNVNDLSGLRQFLINLYDSCAQHNKGLPNIDRLLNDYKTEVYCTLFCFNLLFRDAQYYNDKDYEIFILALANEHGEVVCETLCLSAYNDYVLHLFIDTSKSEAYTAKQATLNQLLWAIENGYSYVDISNEVIDKDSSPRVAYKKLFYTGTQFIPGYYTDSFGLDAYKQNQEYNDPIYSITDDVCHLEDTLVKEYYGFTKTEVVDKLGIALNTSVSVPGSQGLVYYINSDKDLYDKPTPVLLWSIFPFYEDYKVGDKITHNLQVKQSSLPACVLSLHDKTDEQLLDWVRNIKTKTTYTVGSRYNELTFEIAKHPIQSLDDFKGFLDSRSEYTKPKCEKHQLPLNVFLAEETFLYQAFSARQIPIKEIVTFSCSVKDTGDFIFYGYGYVSQGILYATFMYVTPDEVLRKRYSPASVYHSALPRYTKQHFPEIQKVNFSELLGYKRIFNFELEYGIGLELIGDKKQ